MAIVSHKWKFLFVLNPRKASTATASIMGKLLDGKWIPEENVLDANGTVVCEKKHSTFGELLKHQLISADEHESYLKLTTVRHPIDSLYSIWNKKRFAYQKLLEDKGSFVGFPKTRQR